MGIMRPDKHPLPTSVWHGVSHIISPGPCVLCLQESDSQHERHMGLTMVLQPDVLNPSVGVCHRYWVFF